MAGEPATAPGLPNDWQTAYIFATLKAGMEQLDLPQRLPTTVVQPGNAFFACGTYWQPSILWGSAAGFRKGGLPWDLLNNS
ncbi:MAG: hypothetical protein IIA60_14930 [Candidatus Marinimicrobia bacterium]|nr:hypothetical protein [Candidatus Neomarinimicrobiota bacterium]